jgi:hypothetical protein
MNASSYRCPALVVAALLAVSAPAQAQSLFVPLSGYNEVPAVSSEAQGTFRAHVDPRAGHIAYELAYDGLEGAVTQAHLHLGQHDVNGGVIAFLCDSATNPDPTGGAPRCPVSGAVRGLLTPANVVGPTAQGLSPGEFAELAAAIRAGVVYINVHSTRFPGGELRGQPRGVRGR